MQCAPAEFLVGLASLAPSHFHQSQAREKHLKNSSGKKPESPPKDIHGHTATLLIKQISTTAPLAPFRVGGLAREAQAWRFPPAPAHQATTTRPQQHHFFLLCNSNSGTRWASPSITNTTTHKPQSVTMRRITKLSFTLGVLAVASFLAPGKSMSLSEAKRRVLVGVLACSLLLPLPPCVCAPRTCTSPYNHNQPLHIIGHAVFGLSGCERGSVSLNLPFLPREPSARPMTVMNQDTPPRA